MWARRAAPIVAKEIARCRELTEQGTLAMQQGATALAEEKFKSALEANPSDVDAHRLFAEALWARGERSAAVAQMEVASQLAPHDRALTVRVGELHLASGDHQSALALADRVLAASPHFAPAWALRGQAHWRADREDAAIADLQRALVYAPTDKVALLALAEAYLQRKQPSRCLTAVHQLLDLCPPGAEPQRALFLEGQAYLANRRARDAAKSLDAATRRGPPSAAIYYALARAEAERGRTEAAIRAAQSALAAEPAHRASHALLAELGGAGAPAATLLRR
jgi:tetratricopeptide (TPR) repeat protein